MCLSFSTATKSRGYDPADWPEFVKDITSWGERYTENTLTIPAATTLKFAERIMPEGMARSPRCLAGPSSTSGPITLLDGNATSADRTP